VTSATNQIRIHPPGQRTTDHDAVRSLSIHAPLATRKAQDVLVAAKKYVEKSGFLSSERSRIQKLQAECYELSSALEEDGFMREEAAEKGSAYVVIEFLSMFSDAFPNWQREYESLNRLIPLFF
jgi:hypothetical protein